jgi:hypothetical protein
MLLDGRLPRIYCISSHKQLIRGGPPAWRLGEGLTTPHHKYQFLKKFHTGAWMGEVRNAYKIVSKPEGKRPYERPRCIWEDHNDKL